MRVRSSSGPRGRSSCLLCTDLGLGGDEDVGDALGYGARLDAVLLVVRVLDLTSALRLAYGDAHRVGRFVCVHDDPSVDVAGGAADGLDQGSLAAQEAFLVSVENGDERYLG